MRFQDLFQLKTLKAILSAVLQCLSIRWNAAKVNQALAWLAWDIISHIPLEQVSHPETTRESE
jgi:hypothetical protein